MRPIVAIPPAAAETAAPTAAATTLENVTRWRRLCLARGSGVDGISLATDGADHARPELAPDPRDDDVEARARCIGRVAPDGLQDIDPRNDAAAHREQQLDDRPLARGDGDLL